MVTTVRGKFNDYTAEIHLDEENVANSTARIEIDAASVDTGNSSATTTSATPTSSRSRSTRRSPSSAPRRRRPATTPTSCTGDLTIRGITKPVSIEFEQTGAAVDPWGNFRVGFEGKTKIDRTDWGVSFNAPLGAGGLVISEKVTLEFDIAAVRRASVERPCDPTPDV